MAIDRVETAKADTKKVVADIGNKVAHAKADANADVEKIKANFEHDEAEKKVAYAKADIKANAEKAKADVENKAAHVKADAGKARADIGKTMTDALK
jgi:F0F1-type ATP synthase membrane subunit b/b'